MTNEEETLKCSRCKRDLPKTMFYKTTNYWSESRGYTYICKDCSRDSARKSLENKKRKQDETTTTEG
jgi:DNA-directed RNA polymerase subunit RPC12/RpoP